MGLDMNRLENVNRQGGVIISRCPACAEDGHDRKGNHLFISSDDRFGCVLFPGEQGGAHRKRIFELVGIKDDKDFSKINIGPVNKMDVKPLEVVESGILGRLGRLSLGLKRGKKERMVSSETYKNSLSREKPVPNVPEGAIGTYTLAELELIQSFDEETLRKLSVIKACFNGTIIKLTE